MLYFFITTPPSFPLGKTKCPRERDGGSFKQTWPYLPPLPPRQTTKKGVINLSYEKIGLRMKQKREELKLSQKNVSDKAEISKGYYGQIERGECSPSLETTDKIAKVLEVSLAWLLNDRSEVMEHRVNEEIKRLKETLNDVPEKELKTVEGLITQAARLRVLLDDNWKDIVEKGEYELFSQSETQKPYERKRPIVDTYDNRDKVYKDIIRQLTDLVPKNDQKQRTARDRLLGR